MSGTDLLLLAASAAIGYLIGSLPFAYMAARAAGVNILNVGTGNPGAANVYRSVSRPLGALVFLADVSKGIAPVFIALAIGVAAEQSVIAGAAGVIGHWRPVLPRLGGGAGLATGVGAIVAVTPVAGAIGLGAGLLLLVWLKSSGHSAGFGLLVISIVGYAVLREWAATSAAVGMGGLVMSRHLAILVRDRWRARVT